MKYLILVPLMMGMLTYVSYSQEGSDVSANKAEVDFVEKPESAQQDSLLEVPFAVVEQAPIFPGCESRRSNEERKSCMSEMISDFVNRNFNTSLGKELGLKGLNRIYVQFKISATGEVTDVKSRAPHPSLGEEAERVVNLLPGMKPGTQKGVKVAVLYSLPISFRVAEEKTIKEEKE